MQTPKLGLGVQGYRSDLLSSYIPDEGRTCKVEELGRDKSELLRMASHRTHHAEERWRRSGNEVSTTMQMTNGDEPSLAMRPKLTQDNTQMKKDNPDLLQIALH